MRAHAPSNDRRSAGQPSRRAGGFTLLEVMVTIALLGLVVGIVIPNLGALVPSARLDGAGREIRAKIAELRSEARIQAKRIGVEFDLDNARWREIFPPEEQLTTDQLIVDYDQVADDQKGWTQLPDDVAFAAAGNPAKGYFEKGLYRLMFDEYGFTDDQVVALRLASDETMVWSLAVSGLTGIVETERSEEGDVYRPDFVQEGAF